MFAVALHVDHVLARYDWKIVDSEYTVMNLLLDDVGLGGSFDRHFSVRCIRNNEKFINQSINQSNLTVPYL